MNWNFPWFGRATDAFTGRYFLFQARLLPPFRGVSVYLRRNDGVFLTYTTERRGSDILIGAYNYLDLAPFVERAGANGLGTIP